MTNYKALKAQIELPQYLGMTDEQIAQSLTSTIVSVAIDVSVGDVEGYLRLNTRITALEDWIQANPTPTAARYAARELLGILSGKVATLRTSDPTTRAVLQNMFAALVAANAGGIVQQDSDNLFGLASRPITLAEQLGLDTRSDLVQEIAAARSLGI